MHNTLYIDESGDTGYTKKSSRYFIVTGICTDDEVLLRRVVRDVQRYKKDKNKTNSLHAYGDMKKIKQKLLQKLKDIHIRCFVSIIDKQKTYIQDPYAYALEKLAIYLHTRGISNIVLARRDTRKRYNQDICTMFNSYGIHITLSNPQIEKIIQIADFYSWATYSHLEHGVSEYFAKISDHVVLL